MSALLLAALAGGCGGSSGSGGQSGVVGEETEKPGGGGFFFVDENQSGGAANLHIAEVRWGRLVDVHEIDANGVRVDQPIYRDMVVEPNILTNIVDYVLDRDPVTQRERLTIQRQKNGIPDSAEFDELLASARDNLPLVTPEDVDSSPPFTTVPRNACVVVRFDDCLNDGSAATLALGNTVKVASGYPPITPFSARVLFDPNHGAVVGGAFHTTRVLVDLTTSGAEAAAHPVVIDENAIGLPASQPTSSSANVAVRVPSETDLGSGQTQVLTNLAGTPLDPQQNGPADLDSPTLDVVRAFQAGNSGDAFNGFLADVDRPRVIGGWPISITAVTDGAGDQGFDFLVDLTFTSTCLNAPEVGDVVTVGDAFLQVTEAAALAGSDVIDLKARSVAFVDDGSSLVGAGIFQAPFHPSLALAPGCWVSFLPVATSFPVTAVSTTAKILARFSEPMDPASLSPFGNFLIVDGASTGTTSSALSHNIIVGEVQPNSDLTIFQFSPRSPMPHPTGVANTLHVELGEALDLAGNRLRHEIPFVDFQIDTLEDPQQNDSVVLRFEAADEYAPLQAATVDARNDLRGQFFYDTSRGSIIPRPVALSSWPVDRSNVLPLNMTRVVGGTANPLNPLGAKLQMLWRYCDLGWDVRDETKYNLDVIGLNWSPANGQVVADFFDFFEIRLGHSLLLPDEAIDMNGAPAFPASGLPASPATFEGNYLGGSNPTVVHNRALGYVVNPANLFDSTSGNKMMPFPLNLGSGPDVTYTWRDTSILTGGGGGDAGQPGIPLLREVNLGVATGAGSVAARGAVPAFGLPLLIELRVFPADTGLGLNTMDVSLAFPPSLIPPPITTPAFRAYSAGGINNLGTQQLVLPDLELVPIGGFNAASTPPGLRTFTGADTVFYMGQLDTVVRVSRIHSVWLDTGDTISPQWLAPVMEANLPLGTGIQLDFRSAVNFAGAGNLTSPYDGSRLDPLGNPPTAPASSIFSVQSPNPPSAGIGGGWSSDITVGNGRRYLQVRFTFVNNIATGLSPELLAIGLPYLVQ